MPPQDRPIIVIGTRLHTYPRNHVILATLATVHPTREIELVSDRDYWGCFRALFCNGERPETILFVQPAQRFAPLIFLYRLTHRTHIIADAFTSAHDSLVADRRLVARYSPRALYHFAMDWLFVRSADTVLVDTEEHADYFRKKFGISDEPRIIVVPVTVDLGVMDRVVPKHLPDPEAFNVLFWGYYIPLQGVEHIIRAAHILKDHPRTRFTLIGNGQTKPIVEKLAKELDTTNVTFLSRMPYEELLAYTKGADLLLGVFGESGKAARVVPNKVVDAAALGKPIVTGETPPVARFFKDGESVFFCRTADPEDLAQTILRAYNAHDRDKVGAAAREVVKSHFSVDALRFILSTL